MRPLRIGINGLGRIGRLFLRAIADDPRFRLLAVNEIAADASVSAHLLQFDSVQGRWDGDCHAQDDCLFIGGHSIRYSMKADPLVVDWSDCDLVIEASGQHAQAPAVLKGLLDAGVPRLLLTAPSEYALNLVYGVNQGDYDPRNHHILSASSCTTNCMAPVIQVLLERFGIRHGSITTVHAPTNSQVVVDRGHPDLRRARASSLSVIPTVACFSMAIMRIFPQLEGRLDGHAVRVPSLTASLSDFVVEVEQSTDVQAVNQAFIDAAGGELHGILGVEDRPLVSVDYIGDPRSCVIDLPSTRVINGTQVKVYAWYDNEWGYVQRLRDLAALIAERET